MAERALFDPPSLRATKAELRRSDESSSDCVFLISSDVSSGKIRLTSRYRIASGSVLVLLKYSYVEFDVREMNVTHSATSLKQSQDPRS